MASFQLTSFLAPDSFPGPFPCLGPGNEVALAPGGGEMRDPGNEVGFH